MVLTETTNLSSSTPAHSQPTSPEKQAQKALSSPTTTPPSTPARSWITPTENESQASVELLNKELDLLKQELKRVKLGATEQRKEFETVCADLLSERDYLKTAFNHAKNDVIHHETELQILREGLHQGETIADDLRKQLEEIGKAQEFAEAETAAMRKALGTLQVEKDERDIELEELKRSCEISAEMGQKTAENLETTRQDLRDALARESAQEESSQSLILAQRELETAYEEAVAQLEAWKAEYGLQEDLDGSLTSNSLHQVNEEGEEDSEGLTQEYEFIDVATELNGRQAKIPKIASKSFKTRLQKLVRSNARVNRPSSHAVRLFAERELIDEIEEYKDQLSTLCQDFSQTDITKLAQLQRFQDEILQKLQQIRLTAAKLVAVRSFSG